MTNSLGIELDEGQLKALIGSLPSGPPFREVIFGTALPKARGLHFGVFWGVEIPSRARPMLFVHGQLADDVVEAVAAQLDIDQEQGKESPVSTYAEGIRLVALADVDERFNSAPSGASGGVVYGGVFWPALSESYLKQRPDRASGQLLRDTGELQQSFTSAGRVYEFT